MSSSAQERQAIIDELAAAIEARRELGDRMEPHVVESFLSRVEGSIDRRVDERLAQSGPPRVVRVSSTIVLFSLIFGVGATAIVSGNSSNLGGGPALVAIIVIWAAITAINVAYARARH